MHGYERVFHRVKSLIFYIIALPFALIILMLWPWKKIRLIRLFADRIGHFSNNVELLLCAREAGRLEVKTSLLFYLSVPRNRVCNQQLYRLWKRQILIVPFSNIAARVDRLLMKLLSNRYKPEEWRWFEEPTGAQDGFGFFKTGITHLHFTEDEHRKAAELLSTVGWSPGMPWVCLLVRDAAYLNHHMPQQDWNYHNYRDADIDHYQKAALFLAERGYFVFRMGKVVSKKFGLNHPRVIDYANSDLNSDFLDIYLAANCHFFISTSAGLDGIAQIFRRPIVFTDLAPMSSQLQPWYPARLFIPKKVKDAAGKMLSFRETEQLLGDSMRPQALLAQYTLSLECNTADEILEVVSEMEARLSGHWHDAPEDEALQRQFQQSFPKNLVSPAYRRFRQDLDIRLGTAFLRRYGSQLWNEGEENAC